MKSRIEKLVTDYKLNVESQTGSLLLEPHNRTLEVSISLGNNEGYYVTVNDYGHAYHLRTHSKEEALKILGVMLMLLPNK